MMSVRAVVLLFVFASTFLSVAEAKKQGTPLTSKLFGSTEHHFIHNPKVVAAWKASVAKKVAATKKASSSRASRTGIHTAAATTVPTCDFVNNGQLGLGFPPAGLTICQAGRCDCPTNEICNVYQSGTLDGMGICTCGSKICTPDVGLTCAPTTLSSGLMSFQCAMTATTPTPSPYAHSKLMRKML